MTRTNLLGNRPFEKRRPSHWPFFVIASMVAILGFSASIGSPLVVLFLVAIILSVALAASPLALLWAVVFGGLVLAGLADLYLPDIRQARWGVVLAALALGFVSIFSGLWARDQHTTNRSRSKQSSVTLWMLLLFLIAVFSAVINLGLTFDTAVGLKGYFQVWGILLAFALLQLHPLSADRFMRSLIWIALLQFPFILHQHFVLVPQRLGLLDAARGIVAQDILVGTFSGSMTGGGAGAATAVLLMTALTIVAILWRKGLISWLRAGMFSLIFLVPLAIGEQKIVLVLLPVGAFIAFEDKVRKSPAAAVGLLSAVGILLAAFFLAFTMLPQAGTSRTYTPAGYLQETLSYNTGDRGYGNSKLNRTSVYTFWASQHLNERGPLVNTLFGYGPGSSKDARGGYAEHSLAAERFAGFGIGLTGLSGLLWDVGILGAAAAVGFFLAAFRLARRMANQRLLGSETWCYLKGAEAGIAFCGLSLLHNNMFVYEIGYQTLLMLLVGYVVYQQRLPSVSSGSVST